MKKILFIAAIAAALVACKSKNEPQPQQQVNFTISNFNATQEPLQASPRRSAASLMDGTDALTDLYLFDGTTLLAHQVNTQEDFGTISVMLSIGNHSLHFIATRSTGLEYDAGVLSCTSLRPTFGKHYNLNVSGSSDENVTLERISGQLCITIEDEIPSGASTLSIEFSPYYRDLNVTTFAGANQQEFSQSINISGRVGTENNTWVLNVITPIFNEQYEPTYTLTVRNGSNQVLGQATGTVPLASNTKTILSGSLFQGTRSFVSLNTAWNADINESF